MNSPFAKRCRSVAILLTLAGLTGCAESRGPLGEAAPLAMNDAPALARGADPGAEIATGVRSGVGVVYDLAIPEDVLAAHEDALSARNFRLYRRLLTPDFEFFPRASDVMDFPWMIGDSWDRTAELRMMGNLFGWTTPAPVDPAQAVYATITILSTVEPEPGRREITTNFIGTVLTSPTDGYGVDTRLRFGLVESGGFWKIEWIRELESFATGREASSWASVKAVFY